MHQAIFGLTGNLYLQTFKPFDIFKYNLFFLFTGQLFRRDNFFKIIIKYQKQFNCIRMWICLLLVNVFTDFLKCLNVDKIDFFIAPDTLQIDKLLIKLHKDLISNLPINWQNQTFKPAYLRFFLIWKFKKVNCTGIVILLILTCTDSQIIIVLIFIILINHSFSL